MTTVPGWSMVIRLYRPTSFTAILDDLQTLERDRVRIEPITN